MQLALYFSAICICPCMRWPFQVLHYGTMTLRSQLLCFRRHQRLDFAGQHLGRSLYRHLPTADFLALAGMCELPTRSASLLRSIVTLSLLCCMRPGRSLSQLSHLAAAVAVTRQQASRLLFVSLIRLKETREPNASQLQTDNRLVRTYAEKVPHLWAFPDFVQTMMQRVAQDHDEPVSPQEEETSKLVRKPVHVCMCMCCLACIYIVSSLVVKCLGAVCG